MYSNNSKTICREQVRPYKKNDTEPFQRKFWGSSRYTEHSYGIEHYIGGILQCTVNIVWLWLSKSY